MPRNFPDFASISSVYWVLCLSSNPIYSQNLPVVFGNIVVAAVCMLSFGVAVKLVDSVEIAVVEEGLAVTGKVEVKGMLRSVVIGKLALLSEVIVKGNILYIHTRNKARITA